MSDEQQQQQQRSTTAAAAAATQMATTTAKSQVVMEDNFAAMRHAAMSMFKQRTKDLTMVSSLTAEAEGLEQLNLQVQSTIGQLQEQKALLEAHIETEECRVREREGRLREIHAMLSKMTEDQGVFSEVRRATEKITMTLHEFVTQHTAKGCELGLLLERAQGRVQGRAPNDWRTITNDLRRRQSVLDEHIRNIERHHTIPQGLRDMLLEWTNGVWRQQPECAPALSVCEQLLCNDAAEKLRQRIPLLVCNSGEIVEKNDELGYDDGDECYQAYAGAYLRELETLVSVGREIEKECDDVGLCCAVVSPERAEVIKKRWSAICERGVALQGMRAELNDISVHLEERLAMLRVLTDRVFVLDERVKNVEADLVQEKITVQREMDMHERLFFSWQKALQTSFTYMQHEIMYQSAANMSELEAARLEAELTEKTRMMETEWMTFHKKIEELYSLLLLGAQELSEAVCQLKCETEKQREEEERLDAVRNVYLALEETLLKNCDEINRGVFTSIDHSLENFGDNDEEKDISQESLINSFLQVLLQCQQSPNLGEENEAYADGEAFGSLIESTRLDVEVLRRAARCIAGVQTKTNQEIDAHCAWKKNTENEIAILAAE